MEYTDALQTLFDMERDLQREDFSPNGWEIIPNTVLDGVKWEKTTLPFTIDLKPQFNADTGKWDTLGVTFINKLTSSEFELFYTLNFSDEPKKLFEDFKEFLKDLFFSM